MASTAATGGAAAATTRHGITSNTVVDMADERGNNEPWTEAMKRLAGDDTLLKFPDQDIPIDNYGGGATESAIELKGNNFGMLGQPGTRFVFPSGYNYSIALNTNGTTNTNVLFKNIDIDLTAEDSTPGLVIKATDNLQVHDVRYIGAGDTNSADVQNALMPTLTEGGSGTIKNVTVLNKGELYSKHEGNGNTRVGIYIGSSNYGTITIKNCRFEGFPNNGLYTSRTHGTVHVEGGVYRNNDVSQVRLGSDGSYVRGATIEVDPTKSNSPNPYGGHGRFGVKIDARAEEMDEGDVEVDDCDIRIALAKHIVGDGRVAQECPPDQ